MSLLVVVPLPISPKLNHLSVSICAPGADMKLDYESTEPDVRIEIVPLIDVIFCILTFFILAAVTLTRQAAINVDLPRAASATTQLRQILIVSVDAIGQTYVEKSPVDKAQLLQAITGFRQQNPEGMMVLYASRSSSYNDVVQVLDLLRAAGGDRVALATLPGESASPANPPSLNNPDLSNPGFTSPSLNSPGLNNPGSNNNPGLGSPSNPSSIFPTAPNSASPAPNSFNFGSPAPRDAQKNAPSNPQN
jgi:biopolymer transport protein ExbD